MPQHVIIIDDDPFSNSISEMVLRMAWGDPGIDTFTEPQEGFAHIATQVPQQYAAYSNLVLLDLDMPEMSGWEVLEYMDALEDGVKDKVKVLVLSASINEDDKERALHHPLVSGYVSKPLSVSKLYGALQG